MPQVGIRYLKTHLSRCLTQVKRGQVISITDRKKIVAVLSPCSAQGDLMGRMERLRASGVLTGGHRKPLGLDHRVQVIRGPSLSHTISEDRG
jgi:antitoxin (DNA-binding transcriptional repressor) of toxin-antitoxin stability system